MHETWLRLQDWMDKVAKLKGGVKEWKGSWSVMVPLVWKDSTIGQTGEKWWVGGTRRNEKVVSRSSSGLIRANGFCLSVTTRRT